MPEPFVDIHCHLTPSIDDGATDDATAIAMARMAVEHGTKTIIATPHQLGGYAHNSGDEIRSRVANLNALLAEHTIPLTVLPGGDVRIDENLPARIEAGEVMTLGDHRKHILLELPHELYVPLEPLLDGLARADIVGILSHPERNAGILRKPELVGPLVERGCLMQVTAGSLTGSFGSESRRFAEWMLAEGLIHFLASDGHGLRSRRPILLPAFQRAAELVGEHVATELCCRNPAAVAAGEDVAPGRRRVSISRIGRQSANAKPKRGWLRWSKAS